MKKLTFLFALVAMCANLFAGHGNGPVGISLTIDGVTEIYRIGNEDNWQDGLCEDINGATLLSDVQLGSPVSLILNGGLAVSWINEGEFYLPETAYAIQYRVYPVSEGAKSLDESSDTGWETILLNNNWQESGDHFRGENFDANIDLLSLATGSGDFYFDVRFRAINYWNDQGPWSNYYFAQRATFTVFSDEPYAKFTPSTTKGLAPLSVSFTNESGNVSSYSWNFGDGSPLSTEENPTHEFTNAGEYTVVLTATEGDVDVTYSAIITVFGDSPIPGEMLAGGTPLLESAWSIATLGNGQIPTLTWDVSDFAPTGSVGNAVRVQQATYGDESCLALYQTVVLQKEHEYQFDCLFRDLNAAMENFWMQIYITKEQPTNTGNLSIAVGQTPSHIGELSTWAPTAGKAEGETPDSSVDPVGLNGSFSSKAVKGGGYSGDLCKFIPDEDGEYYFIIRIGVWNSSMDVSFSDLSLKDVTIPLNIDEFTADDLKINNIGQQIEILSEGSALNQVAIYDLKGICLETASFSGNFLSQELSTGLYIVNINGKGYKILVK